MVSGKTIFPRTGKRWREWGRTVGRAQVSLAHAIPKVPNGPQTDAGPGRPRVGDPCTKVSEKMASHEIIFFPSKEKKKPS